MAYPRWTTLRSCCLSNVLSAWRALGAKRHAQYVEPLLTDLMRLKWNAFKVKIKRIHESAKAKWKYFLSNFPRFPKEHCLFEDSQFSLVCPASKGFRWVWSNGRKIVTGGSRSIGTKRASVPLYPPQIPHGQARDRALAFAVRGRRLPTWARSSSKQYLKRTSYLTGNTLRLTMDCENINY